mmetsp:Transcript_38130/g.105001  ORF Transcript_38130/g.105001 Transcript_38130/m.105001 type:complete len:307 (-) Transcript_38130:98-1018(-)
MASYKVKNVADWTPSDVQDFLQAILPGHPCADCFTYTSGYVLCSMDKNDLRRQARDEEAANIIWAELKGCKGAPIAIISRRSDAEAEAASIGSTAIAVYVRARGADAHEFQVFASDTVASLKAQVAEREGTAVETQRLIHSGMNMQDSRTLGSYDVRQGAMLLLVPQLKDQGRTRPMTFAPRGVLMVPGGKAWSPSPSQRPYLPVLYNDISLGFPVSIEFESTSDSEAFAMAAKEESPILVVQPLAGEHKLPMEMRVHLDLDTQGVRLDATKNDLSPETRYDAFVHLGGRGGEVRVAIVTGANVLG